MLVHRTKFQFLLPLLLWFPGVFAQQVVELNLSNSQSGFVIRTLTGNGNSSRQHRGPMLFCDRAAQHSSGTKLSAFGHILLVQGDSIIIKSDSLLYDSNSHQATLYGHVMFQDRRTILTTEKLVYSLSLGIAQYVNRARIVDNRTVVTSQQGTYDAHLKQFTFRNNVRLVNGPKSMVVDSLRYTTTSQLVARLMPASPVSKTGVLIAQQNVRPNPIIQAKTAPQNAPESANPGIRRDTLIAQNLITSTTKLVEKTTKVVSVSQANSESSTPKQLAKHTIADAPQPKAVVATAVLASIEKTPAQSDSIRVQPALYRTPVQTAVATSFQVNKKAQERSVDQPVINKPVARASIIRTAAMVSPPPSADISQESELERELNKKRRFN